MTEQNEEVQQIKMWQHMMQSIHPVVEKELVQLALVLFRDAQKCNLEINLPDLVKVTLVEYPGVKKYVNRYIKRYPKHHKESAKQLALGVDFWMPRNKYGIKPKIEIYWSDK